ncbi:MAG: hypothetical protein D3924_19075, partial [Candidatus Electrothrix sp. AR4]|nr:hypothetical protein [Candidatus Electrothrix sp. AR4]
MKKILGLVLFCYTSFFLGTVANAANPTTLMYVANEDDHNVMVVNLDTEDIIAEIPTGDAPHAIVFAGGKAYVNNRKSNHLTVIDSETMELLDDIQLKAISFQLSLSPDGDTLAVSYKNALMVSLIDVRSDEKFDIEIGATPTEGFFEKPMKHPFWSKGGGYLYVQNNIDDLLVKIDTDTYKIVAEIDMLGRSNHDLVSSANGKILYAVNQDNRLDPDSESDPDFVPVTSFSVIDTEFDVVIQDIVIPLLPGEKPFGHHGDLTPDGKTFYFCNEGGHSVTLIDTVNMSVIKSLEVGNGAGHPVFSRNNQKVFIIPHKDNMVSVIDVASQEVIAHIEAGEG